MFIIADSGSTKTEWALVNGKDIRKYTTGGINPALISCGEISDVVDSMPGLVAEKPEAVYFYGAGCIPSVKEDVKKALSAAFGLQYVFVESDLLGAARSLCGNDKGIACILGTGSNSALYDGKDIIANTPSLGFILGDEGSGSAMGKKLVTGVFKGLLSRNVRDKFFSEYGLSYADIVENVYKKPFPNRFLAGFSRFILENAGIPDIRVLIHETFSEFIEHNLLSYEGIKSLPVSFTGSIAFYFREYLGEVMEEYSLKTGRITASPVEGLIEYHTRKDARI